MVRSFSVLLISILLSGIQFELKSEEPPISYYEYTLGEGKEETLQKATQANLSCRHLRTGSVCNGSEMMYLFVFQPDNRLGAIRVKKDILNLDETFFNQGKELESLFQMPTLRNPAQRILLWKKETGIIIFEVYDVEGGKISFLSIQSDTDLHEESKAKLKDKNSLCLEKAVYKTCSKQKIEKLIP